MDLRKLILSTSCLVFLTAPAPAAWDQDNQEKQFSARSSVQAQLERLERENEQLRNAITQMRRNANKEKEDLQNQSYSTQIQALIQENKRLIAQLDSERSQNIDDLSVSKIYSLNQDNDRLTMQLRAVTESNQRIMQENRRLREPANIAALSDTSSLEAEIKTLKQQNQRLKSEKENQNRLLAPLKDKIAKLEQDNSKLKKKTQDIELALKTDSNSLENKVQEKIEGLEKKSQALEAEKENQISVQASLKAKVELLEQENSNLKKESQGIDLQRKSDIDGLNSNVQAQSQEITKLEREIKNLEQEKVVLNSKLSELERSPASVSQAPNTKVTTLENQIKVLEKEKTALSKKLNEKNDIITEEPNENIALLLAQNNSLRETIKAQTDSLNENATVVKKVEALITENLGLKRQLEFETKAKYSNDETAQNLVKKNQELIESLNDARAQVEQLQGLTETVKQLRMKNDSYAQSVLKEKENNSQITALKQQMKGLQEEIKKKDDLESAYRAEIGEYQKRIKDAAIASDIDEDITALQLENQELKARIQLLAAKQQKKSVVFREDGEETVPNAPLETDTIKSTVTYIKPKKQVTTEVEGVKIIETSYPKVDKVKPLLNANGNHIYESVKPQEVISQELSDNSTSTTTLKPEDLLSQELKPLSQK